MGKRTTRGSNWNITGEQNTGLNWVIIIIILLHIDISQCTRSVLLDLALSLNLGPPFIIIICDLHALRKGTLEKFL